LLEVARDAAQQQALDLTCCLGDAAALPVPDASCDCALSNFGILFAPDPDAAVAELVRALAANGRVALIAWVPGSAVGAFASAAHELVREAMGAPPAASGFPWHDGSAVDDLFSCHGMSVAVAGRHELTFTAPSARAYLEDSRKNHPLAVTGFRVLQQRGLVDQATERLLEVLNENNEDAETFRRTSAYVVLVAKAR
jgi:SAM-dependent methyltransferase